MQDGYTRTSDYVLLVDYAEMRFLDANDEYLRLRGITREELLALSPWEVYFPNPITRRELAAIYDEVIAAAPQPMRRNQVRVHATTGETMSFEVQRLAVQVDGRWVILITGRDISDRLRAEAEVRAKVVELERSNKELEQYAYVISHDLSEPLRMVASFTQLLKKRYVTQLGGEAGEFMDFIIEGAQRMKLLVDDLLIFSRAGRPRSPARPVSLDKALDDALANLAHAISTTDAVIHRQPLPSTVGEATALCQLFQNLVGNAIKFRAPGVRPEVHIAAEDAGSDWDISVADNGIGIEERYFERIFTIFQRLHPRDRYEGTGVGLALCKKIAQRYGGSIAVASEPGKGSVFTVRLPKNGPAQAVPA